MSLDLDLYRDLYERAPCGYVTVDAAGVVDSANLTLLEWIGRGRDEVVGSRFLELLTPASQLFFETRLAPILHLKGEAREVLLQLRRRDGVLPALINARHVSSREGSRPGIRIAIFDATQRLDYERQLLTAQREAEVSEARVRTLQRASTAFGDSPNESHLADELVTVAKDAMAATACAVVLVDGAGATTVVAGEHPLTALAADPAVAGEIAALRTAGVVSLGSIDEVRAVYPGLVAGLLEARIEAFSIVPIHGRTEVLGALICFFGRPRALSDEDLELQLALAHQAAQALTRIRLQDELIALALYDPLTGLANRRLLREHLIQGMAASRRRARPMAMLALDLEAHQPLFPDLRLFRRPKAAPRPRWLHQ